MKYAEIGTDGTGLKTNNAESYRITKYGDPDAKRRKHLVVLITADVKTKRLMGIEAHIEGNGISEPEAALKQTTVYFVRYCRREFRRAFFSGFIQACKTSETGRIA